MSFDSGLLAPPPLLRTLAAADAPFPGDLRAGTPPTVWVPVQDLPSEIWRVRGGEHVLTPADLARTPDGHAALLPHCPHRLIALVAGRAWEAGAIVTAAVSVLRGAAEAERCGFTVGSWWVDTEGCPLLAPTGAPWQADTVALLNELAEAAAPGLRHTVREAAALIDVGHTTPARRERVEDELFAAAEPTPLPTAGTAEGAAGVPAPRHAARLAARLPARLDGADDDLPPDAASWVAPLMDHDLAARALGVLGDVRSALRRTVSARRGRGLATAHHRAGALTTATRKAATRKDGVPRTHRRSPLLLAAAIAAVTIVAGLAWPDGERASSAPPESAVSPPSPDQPTLPTPAAISDPPATDAGTPAPSDGIDDSGTARRLLSDLASCVRAQKADCSVFLEDPGVGIPDAGVLGNIGEREVTLVDEYGGVAAYRVTGGEQPDQVLVLVQMDGKWLIRDVYDVADQP